MDPVRETREALDVAKRIADGVGVFGCGVVMLFNGSGQVVWWRPFTNVLTTVGDQFFAEKVIVGLGPTPPSAPTAVNGTKYGTATTAATKSGTASAIGATYVSGSNATFDSSYPSATAVAGTDTGWYVNWQTTVAAGTGTSSTINEVALVKDAGTNATSTSANTIARAVVPTADKTALLAFRIAWSHKILGA